MSLYDLITYPLTVHNTTTITTTTTTTLCRDVRKIELNVVKVITVVYKCFGRYLSCILQGEIRVLYLSLSTANTLHCIQYTVTDCILDTVTDSADCICPRYALQYHSC